MTQEQSFQILKHDYISDVESHIKALENLTLDNYVDLVNLYDMSCLRAHASYSSINLSSFIFWEVADMSAEKLRRFSTPLFC